MHSVGDELKRILQRRVDWSSRRAVTGGVPKAHCRGADATCDACHQGTPEGATYRCRRSGATGPDWGPTCREGARRTGEGTSRQGRPFSNRAAAHSVRSAAVQAEHYCFCGTANESTSCSRFPLRRKLSIQRIYWVRGHQRPREKFIMRHWSE